MPPPMCIWSLLKMFFSVHDVCPLRTKALSYEPVGAQRVAAQTCCHLQISNMNNLFPTRSMIFPWPAEPQQRRLQVQHCAYSFEKARRWHVLTCVETPEVCWDPKAQYGQHTCQDKASSVFLRSFESSCPRWPGPLRQANWASVRAGWVASLKPRRVRRKCLLRATLMPKGAKSG